MLVLLAALAADPSPLATPFTAEQIRGAMPVGAHIALEVRERAGTTRLDWTVLTADADGMTWRSNIDPPGAEDPPAAERAATWVELEQHASFPADHATRRRASVRTPWGRLDGWRYDVHEANAQGEDVFMRLWFADAIPGPPVRMISIGPGGARSELVQIVRDPLPSAPAGSR
ncbi:MAG TPA: hypothetical protein PKA64_06050 [Myxococcota bacterium]|nr:hypothetical protein [Myxococcota bacterium]